MVGRLTKTLALVLLSASALLLFTRSLNAVIFLSTGDPEYNTTAPTGALTNSGWDLQGEWGIFLGTPIASNYFITARHVAGTDTNAFVLNGKSYRPLTAFHHRHADLTLWKIDGSFTNFAQLYDGTNELHQPLVVFGRGLRRGEELRVDGELRGWHWSFLDGRLRWGENQVHAITTRRGEPITNSTQVQLLRAIFRTNAGPSEAHLAVGDSGGGVFIQQNGTWKLAGINFSVDGKYNTNSAGLGFDAALFDERGLYKSRGTNWIFQSGAEIQPGGFYATRISAYRDWIDRVIQFGNPFGEVIVETTPSLDQPFTPSQNAEVNLETQTILFPTSYTHEFIRLRSLAPIAINSITNTASGIAFQFEEN
ncbi:MAG TPA: hypothetical protein VF773_10250 [Verrucomicrobiae bacterium]